jgi:formate dehydrogenase major subunit
MRPLRIDGRTVHQVGIPFHWGYAGESVGDVANDLVALTAEPNVSIQEDKAFGVEITAGRSFNSNQTPTKPYAPWPTVAASPQTPRSAQPEGMIYKEPRQ